MAAQERGQPADETAGAVAAAPDPALTLRPERLAGSARCLNCGTALAGPFCYYCGQPDRNFMRFFPALMREFLEEFIDLDSRFARTMKPLMFKPGRLTRDYLEGRRFRYTPPLRLYLFASIGFFLLAASLSSNAIRVNLSQAPGSGEIHLNIDGADSTRRGLTPEQQADVERALEEAGIEDPKGFMDGFKDGWSDAQGAPAADETFTAEQIMVDGKPWNRETNPVKLDFMPALINDWINQEIEQSPAKARRINDNPNVIVEQIFDLLPGTMFVLLPVVALLFKFWYAFAKRYYIEHLIYALHNHAFIFVSLIVILLTREVGAWAAAHELPHFQSAARWLLVAASIWIPFYLLLSLRHVYQQGWFMTLAKFALIGLSYVTLLALVTSVVAVLGFVLL